MRLSLVLLAVAAIGGLVYVLVAADPNQPTSNGPPLPVNAEAAALQPCPTAGLGEKGTPITAAGWSGSVSGISCEEAGQAISRDFAGAFIEVVSDDTGSYATEDLETMEPGLFRAGGFDCIYGRHDPRFGWPVTCRRGDEIVAFTLSP